MTQKAERPFNNWTQMMPIVPSMEVSGIPGVFATDGRALYFGIVKPGNDSQKDLQLFIKVSQTGTEWSEEHLIPGQIQSSHTPSMVIWDKKLCCVWINNCTFALDYLVLDSATFEIIKKGSFEKASAWRSNRAPALVSTDNMLYCAVLQPGEAQHIHLLECSGAFTWTIPESGTLSGIGTQYMPALAWYKNVLYCFWNGWHDDGIFYSHFSGGQWAQQKKLVQLNGDQAPAVAVLGGQLYIAQPKSKSCITIINFDTPESPVAVINDIDPFRKISISEFRGTLFCTWLNNGDPANLVYAFNWEDSLGRELSKYKKKLKNLMTQTEGPSDVSSDHQIEYSDLFDLDYDAKGFSIKNARLLVQAANLVYVDDAVIKKQVQKWQMQCKIIKRGINKCLVMANRDFIVVSFRGTNSPANFFQDILAEAIPYEKDHKSCGYVHEGFYQYGILKMDDTDDSDVNSFSNIISTFRNTNQPIWITGDSLGGALAVLSVLTIDALADFYALYTFGQPVVGGKDFVDGVQEYFKGKYFRIVNEDDPVPVILPRISLEDLKKYNRGENLILFWSICQFLIDRVFGGKAIEIEWFQRVQIWIEIFPRLFYYILKGIVPPKTPYCHIGKKYFELSDDNKIEQRNTQYSSAPQIEIILIETIIRLCNISKHGAKTYFEKLEKLG